LLYVPCEFATNAITIREQTRVIFFIINIELLG
jgi:hypothetical protein